MNQKQEHRHFGERRNVRRLVTAFLFVAGMGFGMLLSQQPLPAQQQANVAVREPSSLATRIAVIEERMRGQDTALMLQADKYESRLQALNHQSERILAASSKSLDIETFNATMKGLQDWRDSVEKRLTTIEQRAGGASGFRDVAVSTLLTIIAVVGFVFMLLTKRRGSQAPTDTTKERGNP